MKRVQTMEERFWKKVNKTPTCWLWTGSKVPAGYGKIRREDQGPLVYTHRYAWELHFGPIPDGQFICHTCDNPSCVRIDHLFVGTRSDNMQDMHKKRRGRGQNTTHCPQGHAWTPQNTAYTKAGSRVCRTCARANVRRVKRNKKRAAV